MTNTAPSPQGQARIQDQAPSSTANFNDAEAETQLLFWYVRTTSWDKPLCAAQIAGILRAGLVPVKLEMR